MPSLAALKERLASSRLCFFDYIRSDRVSGLSCLAVPILDHNDRATAAIGVLGLWSKFDEMANTILGELLAGGAEVSRQLGSRLPWPAAPDRT